MLTKRLYRHAKYYSPIPIAIGIVTNNGIKIADCLSKHPYKNPVNDTDNNWSIVLCPVSYFLRLNINKIILNHEMDNL